MTKCLFKDFLFSQVKKWSKSIDLFSKDYIIVPINEHQHWYLAIICYPWLESPHYEDTKSWKPANKRSERSEQDDTVDEKDIDGVLSKVFHLFLILYHCTIQCRENFLRV